MKWIFELPTKKIGFKFSQNYKCVPIVLLPLYHERVRSMYFSFITLIRKLPQPNAQPKRLKK